jgi:hypothetical protein
MPMEQADIKGHEPITQIMIQRLSQLETERIVLERKLGNHEIEPASASQRIKEIERAKSALAPILYWMSQLELFSPGILRMEQDDKPPKKKKNETKAESELEATMREIPNISDFHIVSMLGEALFELRCKDLSPSERGEVGMRIAAMGMVIHNNNC